jgi:hypothetical protein
MDVEDHPGYLGLTSAGVMFIHADWPVYAIQHGWFAALASLGMFPAGTVFTLLSDIDRCVLLLANGISTADDPFSGQNFHVALWHEDVLELVRRGFVRGPIGVTARVHQVNTILGIASRPLIASWPGTVEALHLPRLYVEDPSSSEMVPADLPNWEDYDDEFLDWLHFPSVAGLTVTDEGLRSLEEVLSLRFELPPSLRAKLIPMLEAGLYDSAIREVSVHLEGVMRSSCGDTSVYGQRLVDQFIEELANKAIVPDAWLKVLRSELRTAFKFVRNEFAHNAVEMSRARGLSLLERMSKLYEDARSLANGRP